MSHVAYIRKQFNKVVVEAPRSVRFAKAVQAIIPREDRTRNGAVWYFDEKHALDVVLLVAEIFVHVSDTSGLSWPEDIISLRWYQIHSRLLENELTDEKAPRLNGSSSARSKLFVTEDAPPEVVRAAYKALSKKYHPDAGGSHEQMQEINQALKEIGA